MNESGSLIIQIPSRLPCGPIPTSLWRHLRFTMDRDFDVVVLGSGGAGNSAAGLSDRLLEAGGRIGGSTVLSGGVFMAGSTSVQKAAGIEIASIASTNFT